MERLCCHKWFRVCISLAYRRSGEGCVERLCCHKWFRVCTSILTCIAIDDLLGGGRREELSALMPNPNRLYIRQRQ